MKRHIATALLLGIGLAGETPQSRASDLSTNLLPARRLKKCETTRAPEFGHLKSSGRFRRCEIANLFIDDGTLYAEWSGQVDARQPRRIETEELDAEWMAHIRGSKSGYSWFLTRRELVASEGKLWTVQVYGDASDLAKVQLVATVIDAIGKGGKNAQTINYTQTAESVRISVRGNHQGTPMGPWTAVAETLSALREKCPGVIKDYLEPALAKMVC